MLDKVRVPVRAVQEKTGREGENADSPASAADSSKHFAEIAARLYTDEAHWRLAQAHGEAQLDSLPACVCLFVQRCLAGDICLKCCKVRRSADASQLL